MGRHTLPEFRHRGTMIRPEPPSRDIKSRDGVKRNIYASSFRYEVPDGEGPLVFTEEERTFLAGLQKEVPFAGTFAVVVPTFNRALDLPRAFESLLAQAYAQWVAIVLDDGSADETYELMQTQWLPKDRRFRYLRYGSNRGGVAMNERGMALAVACAEYWARLGSDDGWGPNKLLYDARVFDMGYDACYGTYRHRVRDELGQSGNASHRPRTVRGFLADGKFCPSWANVAARTSALAKVRERFGRFVDARLRNMEDFLFNARLSAVGVDWVWRGVVDGDLVVDPQEEGLLSEEFEAFWNNVSTGASGNSLQTDRDYALTLTILKDQAPRSAARVYALDYPKPAKQERTRWVSLSADAAPTYAAWAPVAARVWAELGYGTVIHVLENVPAWRRPFGIVVLSELVAAGAVVTSIAPPHPLSSVSTIRASRLFGARHELVGDDDFVLTADVDMLPLSREFFDREEDFVVLRPLYQRWLHNQGQEPSFRDADFTPYAVPHQQVPGALRFPMCYVGATAKIWRELVPPDLGAWCQGLRADCPDLDELRMTDAIFRSPRVRGELRELSRGYWARGELRMHDPLDFPLLSPLRALPRGMLCYYPGSPPSGWRPEQGPIPAGAIDCIPPRFDERPWWAFEIVRMCYPQLSGWLDAYRAKLERSGW